MELSKNTKFPKYKIEKVSDSMILSGLKKIEEENKKIFFILMMQALLNLNYQNLKINLLENQSSSSLLQLRKVQTLLSSLSENKLESFLQSFHPNVYLSYNAVQSYIIQNVSSGANISSQDIRLIFNSKDDDKEDWLATKKRTYSRAYSIEDASKNKEDNQQSQSQFKYLVDLSSPEISPPSTSRSISRSSSESFLLSDLENIQLPIIHQPIDLKDIKIKIQESKNPDLENKQQTEKVLHKEPSSLNLEKIKIASINKRSPSLEELAKSGKVKNAISLIQQSQSAFQVQEEDDVDSKKKKKVSFVEEDVTDLTSLDSSSSQDSLERFRSLLSLNYSGDLQDLTKEQEELIKILLKNERFASIFNAQSEDAILANNANSLSVFNLLKINDVFFNKNEYDQQALKAENIMDFYKFRDAWDNLLKKNKVIFANYDTKQYEEIGILLQKNSANGSSEKNLELMAQEKYEFLRSALKEHLWNSCSKEQKDELLNQQRFKNVISKTKISDLSQLEKMQFRYRLRKICTNQFFPKDLELALMRLEVDGVEPSNIPRESMAAAERILGIFLNNINKKQESLLRLDNYEEKLIEKTKSALFQGEIGNQLRQEMSGYSDSNPNLATDKLKKFEELIEQNYGSKCLVDCKKVAIDKYNRHQFYTARTEFLGSLAVNHILQELGFFFNLGNFGNKKVMIDDGALFTSWLLNSGEKEVLEKLNKFEGFKNEPLLQNQKMLAKQMDLPIPVVSAIRELDESQPDFLCFIKDNWKNYNLASFNKYNLMLNRDISDPKGWLEPNDIATTFISEVRNRTTPRNANYDKNCNNLGDISVSALNSALMDVKKESLDRDSRVSSVATVSGVRVSGCSRLVDLLLAKAEKTDGSVFHLPSRR